MKDITKIVKIQALTTIQVLHEYIFFIQKWQAQYGCNHADPTGHETFLGKQD